MAKGVRLSKPERTVTRAALESFKGSSTATKAELKAAESAIDKIDASELLTSKPSGGAALGAGKAIEAFREVLGSRLIVPPTPGKLFWITMSRGLGLLGVDEEGCKRIAKAAAEQWRGPVRAESLVRQGAVLLSGYSSSPDSTPQTSKPDDTWDDLSDL